MEFIKRISIIGFLLIMTGVIAYAESSRQRDKAASFVTLGGRGSSTQISNVLSFTYDFDRSPALGMVIVKVNVFDGAGKRVTNLRITGDSGMPSMRGHHDSGEVPFRLSKKGVYLLPVNIVMPGTWDIKLIFRKGNAIIFAGRIEFDV